MAQALIGGGAAPPLRAGCVRLWGAEPWLVLQVAVSWGSQVVRALPGCPSYSRLHIHLPSRAGSAETSIPGSALQRLVTACTPPTRPTTATQKPPKTSASSKSPFNTLQRQGPSRSSLNTALMLRPFIICPYPTVPSSPTISQHVHSAKRGQSLLSSWDLPCPLHLLDLFPHYWPSPSSRSSSSLIFFAKLSSGLSGAEFKRKDPGVRLSEFKPWLCPSSSQ